MSDDALLAAETVSPERALRRLFLTLFLRGRSARGLSRAGMPSSVGGKLATVLAFYAFFGCMAFTLMAQPVFAIATYLHAMTFVLLGLIVATSAGEMLFNKEESDILLHRPIAPRTLLWAKVATLAQVSCWLAAAVNLAGFYVGSVARDGGLLFVPAHLVSTALEALFCTATVVLAYQLCLRWFGRERLDGVMTTVQVLVSVSLVLAGQVVPRLMFRVSGTSLVGVHTWWVALLPPAWFAGIDDAVAGSGARASWGLAALAFVGTGVVLWLAFGRLAQSYQTGLQQMAETAPQRPASANGPLLDRLVNMPPLSWWLRDSVSRAAYLLSAAYLFRDRDVKLRLYPGIAPMLVMPIIVLLPSMGSRGGGSATGGMGGFGVAFAGSYLGLVPLVALGLLHMSQQWQASDIFRIAPIVGPAQLSHGARRAVLSLIALPMLALFAVIVLVLDHDVTHLAMLLPGILALPVYAMYACRGGNAVPLAIAPDESRAAKRSVSMIAVMMSSVILAALAAFAQSRGYFAVMLAVEAVVLGGVYVAMRASLERTAWPALD